MRLPISIYSMTFNNFSQIFVFPHIKTTLYSAMCLASVNGNNRKVNGQISVTVNLHNLLKWSHQGCKNWSQVRINVNNNNHQNNTVYLSDALQGISTSYFLLLSSTNQIWIRYWTNRSKRTINLFSCMFCSISSTLGFWIGKKKRKRI